MGLHAYIFIFLLVGVLFGLAFTNIPLILSPRSRGKKRVTTYESGEDTIGSAWVQFDIIYYLFALIFIAFDVEVVYLFPVLLSYGIEPSLADFGKILVFIGILALALLYAWRKGIFSWK
ncbi:MAG: NADH-quinone oxidoreductase subunit A [Chlamydiae bacterium]|nr:NADH-quinone oxidoreductase subunit A [Chlamydiota bacterium]MBI3277818.1 NADH-quinone oxidoreductase subunit A [Chlamydiota bacterium]